LIFFKRERVYAKPKMVIALSDVENVVELEDEVYKQFAFKIIVKGKTYFI
jgi:hypothetical protein